MTALIITSIAAVIFIVMHFVAKKSKSLHFMIIGLSMAYLLADQFFQLDSNQTSFGLIIALIIFGNFYLKYRTSN
jgi:uncharacterized membrane protein YciS (DUF1049 family)